MLYIANVLFSWNAIDASFTAQYYHPHQITLLTPKDAYWKLLSFRHSKPDFITEGHSLLMKAPIGSQAPSTKTENKDTIRYSRLFCL